MGCTQQKHTQNDMTLKIINALQDNKDCSVKVIDNDDCDELSEALSNKDNTLVIVKTNKEDKKRTINKYIVYYYDKNKTQEKDMDKTLSRSWSMYSLNIPKKKINK